jgi:hypothetical protein
MKISDKLFIINKMIIELQDKIQANYTYIDRINNGMEAPDYSINKCHDIIKDLELKIQALEIEKKGLITT